MRVGGRVELGERADERCRSSTHRDVPINPCVKEFERNTAWNRISSFVRMYPPIYEQGACVPHISLSREKFALMKDAWAKIWPREGATYMRKKKVAMEGCSKWARLRCFCIVMVGSRSAVKDAILNCNYHSCSVHMLDLKIACNHGRGRSFRTKQELW